jgi:hypothetical protein
MQISKNLSYLSDKMHIEKCTGKNVMKNIYSNRAPEKS